MSNFGGIVGIQEGLEAGLVIGGSASSEENHTGKTIGIGLAATGAGVALGNQLGEGLMGPLDTYIGNGGVSFLPAVAIGGLVLWHNRRKQHSVQQTKTGNRLKQAIKDVPYAAVGLFAGFEGAEAGILTATTNTNLSVAELITLGTAGTAILAFGGLKKVITKRRSPEQAILWTREVALAPAIAIGAMGASELTTTAPGGVAVAAAGTALLATAAVDNTKRIRDSFRRKKS
ncbi:MAG: hypothetical protein H6797_03425 [Candidatus Nomurabacteria bacterium]|nr:MAG: hypothetical protein H6797_03425 [Candidatus Nomurabacteria bacterium]